MGMTAIPDKQLKGNWELQWRSRDFVLTEDIRGPYWIATLTREKGLALPQPREEKYRNIFLRDTVGGIKLELTIKECRIGESHNSFKTETSLYVGGIYKNDDLAREAAFAELLKTL